MACCLFKEIDRMKLGIQSLPIPDVKLIKTERFSDSRGYFSETYVERDFAIHGISHHFVQDNQSASVAPGTVRGLHFQVSPFAQTKLVRVLSGRIMDVAVDLRRLSPTFGKHVAVELSEAGGEQLLVPVGFAHGFCTLEPNTVVFYKVDKVYSAAHDRGLNWADPTLNIAWPVRRGDAMLSDKDRAWPGLSDLPGVFD
jgi:dTDP-4-dehydrorhamnose 3,5-epimerase